MQPAYGYGDGCYDNAAANDNDDATAATTTTVVPPPQTMMPPAGVVVNATLQAEIQTLQGAMLQILAQIQSVQAQLNQLAAQVNAGSGSMAGSGATPSVAGSASAGGSYTFTDLLTVGSTGAQVTALQERLISLGYLSGSVTGFYGTLTGQAVSKYQSAHGISPTGYVGPSTRAALNTGK